MVKREYLKVYKEVKRVFIRELKREAFVLKESRGKLF